MQHHLSHFLFLVSNILLFLCINLVLLPCCDSPCFCILPVFSVCVSTVLVLLFSFHSPLLYSLIRCLVSMPYPDSVMYLGQAADNTVSQCVWDKGGILCWWYLMYLVKFGVKIQQGTRFEEFWWSFDTLAFLLLINHSIRSGKNDRERTLLHVLLWFFIYLFIIFIKANKLNYSRKWVWICRYKVYEDLWTTA